MKTEEPADLLSVVLDGQTQDALGFVTCDQVHLSVKPGILQSPKRPDYTREHMCHRLELPNTALLLRSWKVNTLSNTTEEEEEKDYNHEGTGSRI